MNGIPRTFSVHLIFQGPYEFSVADLGKGPGAPTLISAKCLEYILCNVIISFQVTEFLVSSKSKQFCLMIPGKIYFASETNQGQGIKK